MKFQANLHGNKIKDGDDQKDDHGGTPGDPESYAHLSMEERKRITQEQLGGHKNISKKRKV